ncbi:thioredoxin family protein [Bacillus salacetis]|uniref:Thioredoxin family protein n=1 Tax=Bacillus salacetis TaxID=2315464 RepID=A0A3A1R1D2_9BACI|nr:thioredoxin family protein [Bacillus salacetis]RIW33983.1 thioredoxin family protein [Bacillus salacetis]
MELKQWFEKGQAPQEYIDSMETHQENLQKVYDGFSVPDSEKENLKQLASQKLKVIVLTEDWCGDAMVNLPILLKMAEAADMDVRTLNRDENLELMDQYLTNGTSRAIPIFIFLDSDFNEEAVWGPRAPVVQQLVDEEKAKLPPRDHESFPLAQKEMIGRLTAQYIENEAIWQEVFQSIKTTLMNQVHL